MATYVLKYADTTATSLSGATTWYAWNDDYTCTSNDVVWGHWVVTTASSASNLYASEEREAADARAQALLDAALTETQRKEMREYRYFTVESRTSKRRYRVKTDMGRHGNIEELDERGRVVATLCCAPRGNIPHGDALLGQKLFLEAAEDEFRRTANHTPRRVA